jgi:hypothetical protein
MYQNLFLAEHAARVQQARLYCKRPSLDDRIPQLAVLSSHFPIDFAFELSEGEDETAQLTAWRIDRHNVGVDFEAKLTREREGMGPICQFK